MENEKEEKPKLHRIAFTKKELAVLSHILRQFTDYMAYDDRPDHGLNNLYGYRDLPQGSKDEVYQMSGKIQRMWRKSWNDPKK